MDVREKQIEELLSELIKTNSYGTLNAVAEHLVNAGYRKIPEGAIILTREEIKALNEYHKKHKTGERK